MKITAIIHREYYQRVWNRLKKAGIYNIHQENARYPVLGVRKGLFGSIINSDPIIDNPMALLSILVYPDIEKQVMGIIHRAAELDHPGHGSVYSEQIMVYHEASLFYVSDRCHTDPTPEMFYKGLTGIYCILQRGLGEPISKLLLENGVGVPTISYGTGTGLRDKLGLLKVTIPREKDILKIVVNTADVSHVIDFIIEAGNLDYPGRGFIYEFPITRGLINTRVSLGGTKQAAHIDQIIAALDKLSGGIDWRRKRTELKAYKSSRKYFGGIDIHFYCNEGYGLEIIQALRKVGVSGSTMRNPKLVCKSQTEPQSNTSFRVSPAREACNMLVPESSVPEVLQELENLGAFGERIQGMVYTTRIPKAFTYQTRTTSPQVLVNQGR